MVFLEALDSTVL